MKKGRIHARILLYKRLEDIMSLLGSIQTDVDNWLLKKIDAPRLDPIRKKSLHYPQILFPLRNAPLEWWYFTGHLKCGSRRLGYEFCIFKIHPEIIRIGPIPLYLVKRDPYLVLHAALTDKDRQVFHFQHASGLNKANRISYEGLHLGLDNVTMSLDKQFVIYNDFLNLKLKPLKPITRHFKDGFQIAHERPQSRSYYVSHTRMQTEGRVNLDGKWLEAEGFSWFDHQKCNMIKKSSLIGWDWFGIMLDDQTEVMFYTIRDRRGLNHQYLGGTLVNKKGKSISIPHNAIQVRPLTVWKSPHTDINYPSGWEVKITNRAIALTVTPYVPDQEIDSLFKTGVCYWEGPCKVKGTKHGNAITGEAYVELVGYDRRLLQSFWKNMTIE